MNDNLFDPTQYESLMEYENQSSMIESIRRRIREGEISQELVEMAARYGISMPMQLNESTK